MKASISASKAGPTFTGSSARWTTLWTTCGGPPAAATSHTWSPILKKYLAIASVRGGFAAKGTQLQIEHTVEYERRKVTATVAPLPFYDPERKRKP